MTPERIIMKNERIIPFKPKQINVCLLVALKPKSCAVC